MTNKIRLAVAAGVLSALTGAVGVPAEAQIPEVPPLGFAIAPTEGSVGSQVSGTVDTADVEANCITDPAEFVAQFVDLDDPLGVPTPYTDAVFAYAASLPNGGFADPENDPVDFAGTVALLFPVGLGDDLPQFGGTGELVEAAIAQTFVMAFADIATASPIDPLGSFDRTTGEGSVEVPDIPAGSHPVIATCVGLPEEPTVEAVGSAIEAGAAFVEANLTAPFPANPQSPEFIEAAAQVAPVILRALVEPQALGVQFFTVLGDGPGPGGPGTPPSAPPATPVPGDPDFTG